MPRKQNSSYLTNKISTQINNKKLNAVKKRKKEKKISYTSYTNNKNRAASLVNPDCPPTK